MSGAADDYDYLVVGAGSAGCVLANRLSRDPGVRVALVEAGASDRSAALRIKTGLPLGNVLLLSDPRYNWNYELTGGPSIHDRKIAVPRGKLFGGCSSVNGAIYSRGHPSDYDGWAAAGNPGWSYEDVLPFFRQHENWTAGPASTYHGVDGELDVCLPRSPNPLSRAFLEAAAQAGHAMNWDANGPTQDGFGYAQLNQRRGVRMSSSRAFLHPAMSRSNLTVLAETCAEKIRFRGRRAVGLAVSQRGRRRDLNARREIVLAAGVVNSPQLLMCSGVGPSQELERLGIRVVQDLPGVGANLHDHPAVAIAMENPTGESYALSWRSLPRLLASPLQYLLGRNGMLASNAVEISGYTRSQAALDKPDLQMGFIVGLKTTAQLIPRRHGVVALVALLSPRSRGVLRLQSPDPTHAPVLSYDMLSHQEDVAALIRGVRQMRHILAAPALQRYLGAEIAPGTQVQTDTDLEAALRTACATTYHPVGTCKMGPRTDAMAVVDPRLRVHELAGLRVVDASIMPHITAGNTSAPTMMIAERAAQFILDRSAV